MTDSVNDTLDEIVDKIYPLFNFKAVLFQYHLSMLYISPFFNVNFFMTSSVVHVQTLISYRQNVFKNAERLVE